MKTVLWATQVYPRYLGDPFGGFLHRLARELPARGWRAIVLAPAAEDAPPAETRDGVEIVRFRYAPDGKQTLAYTGEMHRAVMKAPWRLPGFLRQFRLATDRLIRDETPDLVHAHWWIPTGAVVAAACADRDVPWVLSSHGTDVRLLRKLPFLRPLARRVYGNAHRVLPVSDTLARQLTELGMPGRHRDILPMPADGDVFFPPAEASSPSPSPSSTSAPVFVVAARLTTQKRVDIAIEAFARATRLPAGATVEIAGDGPERRRLEEIASRLGVADRVRFLGMLSPEALAERFRASTAVVLTSVDEGYGLTLVEGALCGTPGIAVRSGGLSDLVEDGVNGFLAEPGDTDGVARAMERLAGNSVLRQRMAGAANRRARAATSGPLADRLVDLYGDVLSPDPPGLDGPRGRL